MAKDPYKYFRVEARELLDGLSEGVLTLEKGLDPEEVVARMLRHAHTLKGAARVVKQPAIAELAHTLEDRLTQAGTASRPLAAEQATEILQLIDRMNSLLRTIDVAGKPRDSNAIATPPVDDSLQTVRVDIHDMDKVLRQTSEAAVQIGTLRRDRAAAEHLRDVTRSLIAHVQARNDDRHAIAIADELLSGLSDHARQLGTNVERLEASLGELSDETRRLRLVPARGVFPLLERAVRDAAQALDKGVDFEATGGDLRLDAHVLATLRDALMHVVRNAVTHGIESAAERIAAGKPARGRIHLSVRRDGGRVIFVCDDDGRGIDIDAVRIAAVARGVLTPSQAATCNTDDALALLRSGGLTTQTRVTELSGRGIGLDVVRAAAAQLKGDWQILSRPGHGATFEMRVLVSMASLQGLIVEVAGASAVIPLDAVRRTVRVLGQHIAHSQNRDVIVHDGVAIPFMLLERALSRQSIDSRKRRVWSAVIIESGGRGVAIGVDRLLGTASIVVRTLHPIIDAAPIIAGASLDGDGNPQLVLDPAGLVAAAEDPTHHGSDEPATSRLPILVVDDSLTTRMLEQSILESAGYTVEVATSAEEGLVKARARSFALCVVDVEMPGMDGFAFVSEMRADAVLREVPCILVTSRNAIADKKRGEQVGAQAYIVKGEFDQEHLLGTIRRLVG